MLALGAHSDDLAFSLGAAFLDGRLAHCRPVTVFSRSGWTLAEPAGDPGRVTARRKEEDRCFFSRTLAAPPRWLDLDDAPLREARTVFQAPVDGRELEPVCRALSPLLTGRSILLAPLALGEHIDHRLVREAVCALRGCHRLIFYEDLPYAAFLAPTAIETAVVALAERLGVTLKPRLWESAALLEAKAWAVACYASQTDSPYLSHLLRHAQRLRRPAERVWVPVGDESAWPE